MSRTVGPSWNAGSSRNADVNGNDGSSRSAGVNGNDGANWSAGVNGTDGASRNAGVEEQAAVLAVLLVLARPGATPPAGDDPLGRWRRQRLAVLGQAPRHPPFGDPSGQRSGRGAAGAQRAVPSNRRRNAVTVIASPK